MSKLAFRAQTVDIACLPLRQDLYAKNVLMTAQRDFGLGNNLLTCDKLSEFPGMDSLLLPFFGINPAFCPNHLLFQRS